MDHTVDEEPSYNNQEPEEINVTDVNVTDNVTNDSADTGFQKTQQMYTLQLYMDPTKTCCVCCIDKPIVGITNGEWGRDAQLVDIYPCQFEDDILPDGIMFLSSCGKHYVCIDCLRTIINNYENHPINANNSHLTCPSPFEECVTSIGFQNVFDHNQIQKICRTTQEWDNYISYAQQYAFPGFTLIYCPFNLSLRASDYTFPICNTPILIESEEIRVRPIGELIVECSQNEACLKRFCYYCRKTISYHEDKCNECKLRHENENPNVLNYYFNKSSEPIAKVTEELTSDTDSIRERSFTSGTEVQLQYEETDYLYFNKEITVPFAVEYISNTIRSHHTHMICSVCKISLYKTEKCNGLSHHGIERCYACGRIGLKVRGLGSHWNADGVSGCFRFDSESFVRNFIPNYHCQDSICSNHDKGDCQDPLHQPGIQRFEHVRKKAYVYHALKSLLPSVRYQVYDTLFNTNIDNNNFLEFLPYKQTLVLLDEFKERLRDYYEDIVYKQLNCHHPNDVPAFVNKNTIIEAMDYVISYTTIQPPSPTQNSTDRYNFENATDISAWRNLLNFPSPSQFAEPLPNYLQTESFITTQLQLVFRTPVVEDTLPAYTSQSDTDSDTANTHEIQTEPHNYTLLPPITLSTDQQWQEFLYITPLLPNHTQGNSST